MKGMGTCPLSRLISFLELVLEPTTSGRANVLSIWSAIVWPPPILDSVLDADEAVAASEHGCVPKWLVRSYGAEWTQASSNNVSVPRLYQMRSSEMGLLAAIE